MDKETNFNFMLTNSEMENIFNYLKNKVNWLCLNNCFTKYDKNIFCLIHHIKERYDKIYKSKVLSNFEKQILIKRMFRALSCDEEENHELPYFFQIFNDMKKINNE